MDSWSRGVILGALMAALLGLSCAKKQGYTFRRDYSVNLGVPQPGWPGNPVKTLSPAEQEVYALRGKPDFVRFWWKGRDDYATNLEVPRDVTPETLASIRQSWVYLRQGDEVFFDTAVVSRSEPISDRLKVVLEEGDPEDRRFLPGPLGQEDEEWHYYSSGMVYRFREGKLVDKKRQHDPITGYLKK